MKKPIFISSIFLLFIIFFFMSGGLYTVSETQQAVITQFGRPIGKAILEAGLHLKVPFIQKANYFEKRLLRWDGSAKEIPTKDKRYIWVDTTARWRIVDPLRFLQSVHNEAGAHTMFDDIINAATRNYITSHNLVEVARDTNRLLESIEPGLKQEIRTTAETIERIEVGREALTRGILKQAQESVPQYGIELVDVRIKRINYVEEVRRKVYERMISERKRAAEQYRSEGEGQKAEVEGKMIKELNRIESEAYRKAQEIKGKADAEAIEIYAQSYNKDPEFYSFIKTLETYQQTIDEETTLIFTTEGDYLKYLKRLNPQPPK